MESDGLFDRENLCDETEMELGMSRMYLSWLRSQFWDILWEAVKQRILVAVSIMTFQDDTFTFGKIPFNPDFQNNTD